MALITCPECGWKVSDRAAACPNCGSPFKDLKFCIHCGAKIDKNCVVCPQCGKQVAELNSNDKNIIINNSLAASATAFVSNCAPIITPGKPKNKWVAFFLCLFTLCGHKFYEGKTGMGILYLCTFGLFFVGWIMDLISLASKPNPYYV